MSNGPILPVRLMGLNAVVPSRNGPTSVGLDLFSPITFTLGPGCRVHVPLDLAVEIPVGFFGLIVSRSSLSLQYGVICLGGQLLIFQLHPFFLLLIFIYIHTIC